MSEKSILVAGGAGYIGSHTVKCLKRSGYVPLILDNLSTSSRQGLLGDVFYEGNINDAALLGEIHAKHQIAGAILFAGHAYVGESTSNPRKYYENNIGSGLKFIGALLDLGIDKLVFSSSCSIYGIQEKPILDESLPKAPLSPYAETKEMFERILHWYSHAHGLKSASLRYFNAAGADEEGELGENHDPETHLIPLAILAALGGQELQVFGTDYPTPDGTAIRDYIHVTDLGDAHRRALDYLFAGGETFAANVGTGAGHSILEVIHEVQKVSGKTVPHRFVPRRLGDAPALVANPAYAKKLLGWEPQHSSLHNICKTAYGWLAHKQR
jgi:UDP-arabinose 4-epimerase